MRPKTLQNMFLDCRTKILIVEANMSRTKSRITQDNIIPSHLVKRKEVQMTPKNTKFWDTFFHQV